MLFLLPWLATLVAAPVLASCKLAVTAAAFSSMASTNNKLEREVNLSLDGKRAASLEQDIYKNEYAKAPPEEKSKRAEELTPAELENFAVAPMASIVVLEAEHLPDAEKELAGKYMVSRRDQFILESYNIRAQVRAGTGPLGEAVKKVRELEPRLGRTIFNHVSGDQEARETMALIVKHHVLPAAKLRAKDPACLGAFDAEALTELA